MCIPFYSVSNITTYTSTLASLSSTPAPPPPTFLPQVAHSHAAHGHCRGRVGGGRATEALLFQGHIVGQYQGHVGGILIRQLYRYVDACII
jgi:hypothetical protein